MKEAISAELNYIGPMEERPKFYANDKSRDRLQLDSRRVQIENGRTLSQTPSLDAEGFCLIDAPTQVSNFKDIEETGSRYHNEIIELVQHHTEAALVICNSPGVLRFSERSSTAGSLNNSYPARFIHNDVTAETARHFARQALATYNADLKDYSEFRYFNIWRALTPPPQDIPLALLDSRTLESSDTRVADAIFDVTGGDDWSFEALLVRFSEKHRWVYFPNMNATEALLFTTLGWRDGNPFCVPHTGFDDHSCPPDAPPRASIEMRALAFFQ